MKTLFYFFIFLALSFFGSICFVVYDEYRSDKRESDIHEACHIGDFAKAYELADKENHWRERLYEYIATQEVIYAMSEGYYDRVKSLYQQTVSVIGSGSRIDSFNDIVLGQAIDEDKCDFLLEYISIANMINDDKYKDKLKNYFIYKNAPEAISFLLKDINKKVNEIDSYYKEYHSLPQIGENDEDYIEHYHKFAAKANVYYLEELLNALSHKNTTLATEILSYFKKDIVTDKKGAVSKIIQSNEELEAIQKVQQALQSN